MNLIYGTCYPQVVERVQSCKPRACMPRPTGFDEEDQGYWKAHRATLLPAPNNEQLFGWGFHP
ncbi:unnamed protein product [Penicillium roqueforti FM164]|uniref:Uncharacterized protein n=1 Tax=Penicillium roqueforti (strain FM164) TaxID=1365484 RepID=W6QMW2_PENRF|nr:unnamed protein product [Penicillium roqueforti FM164]